MNTKFCLLPTIGALWALGCAGPLDEQWDSSAYRSQQDRYIERDQLFAEIRTEESDAPSIGLESLQSLSIDDAIGLAINHNPRLRWAVYQVDAAEGAVTQAGLYPNPSLNFDAEALGSDAGGGGETAYAIEQEIVLGGKLDRARDVALVDQMAARAEVVAEEFAVARRVTQAYYACLLAHKRLDLRDEMAELASELLDAARTKVDAGAATVTDQLRAEVVFEQAQIELDQARYQVKASRQELASAIGIESTIDLPLNAEIEHLPKFESHDEVLAAAFETNSRVSQARIAVVRAKQAHRLAKAQGVPDLTVSIGPRYSDIDNKTTLDVGIGIEIPLFDRNQGEIQSALAQRLSASAQLQNVRLELIAEVSDVWAMYESAYASANRYQDQLLPKASRTLDLTRKSYQSGMADYLRVLDAQQMLIESSIAYIDTLQRLHNAVAQLNELSQIHAPWRTSDTISPTKVEVNKQ